MSITPRDNSLVMILATKLRVLSHVQIANEFFGCDFANSRRRLSQLVNSGLLVKQRLISRSIPELMGPVYRWQIDGPAPAFNSLARVVSMRWLRRRTFPTTIYLAASRVSGILGSKSKGKLPHPLHVSHELGLAAAFLQLRNTRPDLANQWLGEDGFPRRSRKKQTPDALIVGTDGNAFLAIEFGGIYTAQRLERFHRYCFSRRLPYEIW